MWKCYFACSPLIEDLASFRLETRQQQQKPQLEAGGSGRREEDHLKRGGGEGSTGRKTPRDEGEKRARGRTRETEIGESIVE